MAAIQAQAAAEYVLESLEAASSGPQVAQAAQSWESEFFNPAPAELARLTPIEPVRSVSHPATQAAAHPTRQSSTRESFEIRYDDDLPVREPGSAISRASHGTSAFESPVENRWHSEPDLNSPLETQGFELVEPAQPINANVIEFPRELVATRKIRPRRAEGPYAESVASQLSIFEVDPGAISFEPAASGAAAKAGVTTWDEHEFPSPDWSGPKWSGLELDEEPEQEIAPAAPATVNTEKAEPASVALPLQTASLNRRLLAAIVDFSLITGSLMAAAMLASLNGMTLHSLKVAELGIAVALPLIGLLYLALFLTLAKATPGMKYANLEICTFAGDRSTRAQRLRRLATLVLSLAPVGLGAAWAIFDKQHLCWHDRLSGTYIRRG
jgi:uncharacterized RDD family membrane protein YckC